ncbi:MAG: IPT/TIG domain-containing protein, partial [Deltaproteobacteria bacterium]|nr:IPT/TIG domain-containing protein [Deltaproteobacteria bacterium]
QDIGGARWVRPEGYAVVTFYVDDSENKTYKDGQMKWNGSFTWDEKSNIAVFSSSWLPTDGPFPPLYDDGPISQGGHEMEGAVAGDHIFSTEIYIKPDKDNDMVFEYGLINEWNNWIWEGPNGQFTIEKGFTGKIDAKGIKFHKFGDIDAKIIIDMKNIHQDFKGGGNIESVFIKGSMNSWTPVQILDNGKDGDEKAGDGIYTYLHSKHLGVHDGLLYMGQHVQFVFVFNSEEGIEYKVNGDAVVDGVKAYTDYGKRGEFLEEEISLELESRGKSKNTTIIVGRGKGETATPIITFVEPDKGPITGGTKVSIRGKNFKQGAKVYFGTKLAENIQFLNTQELGAQTPPNNKGSVDVKVVNPDNKEAVFKNGFTYEDIPAPKIFSVTPDKGITEGGTEVTISGKDFMSGAKVFIGNECKMVNFIDSSKLICKTSPHKKGIVDVIVKNPDGQQDTLSSGFTFYEANPKVDWCNIQWPLEVTVVVNNETDTIYSQVYEEGVTEGIGQGKGIKAQLGYGDVASFPGSWIWVNAVFNVDVGNNDEYMARLIPNKVGEYNYAFRYSMDDGNNWVYCDKDGSDNGYSSAQAGVLKVIEKASNPPKILSVNPTKGSTYGGDPVEIIGENFLYGLKVYFGSKEASHIMVQNSGSVVCKTPAHPAGKVDVKVVNPDGLSAMLAQAFEFEAPAPLPQWGNLQWPYSIRVPENSPSEFIYGQVYHPNITNGEGQGLGIYAQIGYGPRGVYPLDASWKWLSTEYNTDVGNNDEYKGKIVIPLSGHYSYTFRYSFDNTNWLYTDIDGSNNGVSIDQLGRAAIGDVVDWCNIQWPENLIMGINEGRDVYSQVYLSGITNGAGQGADIVVELLYTDKYPFTPQDGTPITALYNMDKGNNDEYRVTLSLSKVGTYYYYFRVKYKNGPWIYCDLNGTDDGFSYERAGRAEIR